MAWRGNRVTAAALLVAALAAGALGACGDSDSSTSTSQASTEAETAAETGGSKDGGAPVGSPGSGSESDSSPGSSASPGSGGDSGSGSSGESGSQAKPGAPKLSDSGSLAQIRKHGGKKGIEEFGEEADGPELEDASGVMHSYMVARAEEDWPAACSHLSSPLVKSLESFASPARRGAGEGCSDVLRAWTPPLQPALREESAIVEDGTLRLEGDEAFLIYRGPQEGEYAIPMTQEDGAWKVGALLAAPLA